jgi:hypothetical protein
MTLEEQLNLLERVCRLINNLDLWPDFLHKDEVVQRLQWTAKNIADDIWQAQIRQPKS